LRAGGSGGPDGDVNVDISHRVDGLEGDHVRARYKGGGDNIVILMLPEGIVARALLRGGRLGHITRGGNDDSSEVRVGRLLQGNRQNETCGVHVQELVRGGQVLTSDIDAVLQRRRYVVVLLGRGELSGSQGDSGEDSEDGGGEFHG